VITALGDDVRVRGALDLTIVAGEIVIGDVRLRRVSGANNSSSLEDSDTDADSDHDSENHGNGNGDD